MLRKLIESISENIQTYLTAYFAKNNISQSFNLEIHDDNGCILDLVFAEGPLEGEVISFSNGKFLYEGKDLAVTKDATWESDEKSCRFLLEDGFVLCAEAILRHDYAVFDPLRRSMYRSRWYLENTFIPNLVDCVSSSYLPDIALESGPGWWNYIERDYDMHFNLGPGFYSNKLEIKEGYVIYFYNFPEPGVSGDALYGAVVFDKSTLSAEYYKLELNLDHEWFLCSQNLSTHRIFGKSKSRERSEFLNWVLNRIA